MSLSPASASVAENTSTATRLKMADIVVTDDGVGSNATTLSGADAASFEVDAGVLYLKAGTLLDFETKTSYSVTISVADASVAGSTPVTAGFALTVTNVNEAPASLALSNASIAEKNAVGAVIGTLSATDPDAGDSLTYSLVAGEGSADNGSFSIDGNQLKAAASFDFEAKASYTIRVKAADGGGLAVEKQFTIIVTNVNEAPTSLALSNALIAENNAVGAVIGTLSATDPDAGDSLTYSLVAGEGSADNGSFSIDGNQLKAAASFDFEAKASYTIRVKAADGGGLAVEKQFTITVTDVVEDFTKPVLIGVAAPVAGTYPSSAKLRFTATFSEPVTVTGPAGISFTGMSGGSAGKAARIATYESGSGTGQIVFSYLIAAGEAATKGLVVAGAIQLPAGGSVADLAGNSPVGLTFTAPAAPGVKVDGSVPVLTKTTGPAAKTFKAGEVLSFSVTWNENVFVVGAPRILIAVGGSPREAVYAGGSGSKTVKFNYVAAAGDNGGVSLGSGAIALSGGTIRDSIGNPAGLVLKAVNLSKVAIDTARPAVVSAALPSAGSYAKGKTATIGVTFGEAVKVTGKPTLAVTVAPGATRSFVFLKATGGTAFFTYKFTAAETVAGFTLPGAISLAGTAAIRDGVGNAAILSLPAPV